MYAAPSITPLVSALACRGVPGVTPNAYLAAWRETDMCKEGLSPQHRLTRPRQVGPGKARSGRAEVRSTWDGQTKPGQARSINTRPHQDKSGGLWVMPGQTRPTQVAHHVSSRCMNTHPNSKSSHGTGTRERVLDVVRVSILAIVFVSVLVRLLAACARERGLVVARSRALGIVNGGMCFGGRSTCALCTRGKALAKSFAFATSADLRSTTLRRASALPPPLLRRPRPASASLSRLALASTHLRRPSPTSIALRAPPPSRFPPTFATRQPPRALSGLRRRPSLPAMRSSGCRPSGCSGSAFQQ